MGWTYHNSFFGNCIMPSKPPVPEHADVEAPTLEALLEHYNRGSLEPLISFAHAVQGSRQKWAMAALHDIAIAANGQLLSYRDGSVEVTVDGENLRVLAKKIPKRDEYQVWVAESSLAALDKLLIARRELYYAQQDLAHEFNHNTTLHPDMASRLVVPAAKEHAAPLEENPKGQGKDFSAPTKTTPTLPARRKVMIGQASPEQEAAKFKRWAELIEKQKAKATQPLVKKPVKPPPENDDTPIVYERDIVVEDLTKILEQKLKNPPNQRLGELHAISDFKLVIEDALKEIELPQSRDEHCHIGSYEMPFGLEQMQELRAEIRHRIDTKPRASAGLGILLQAIDETMEQFWNERPLGVRTQANAGHAK